MSLLQYLTAGESHGKAVVALVEGFPAGIQVDVDLINRELARRQGGFGRGGRMKIEKDQVRILSGLRRGVSLGSPITLMIENLDVRIDQAPAVHRPRPGHADLAGSIKWLTDDCRDVLERASARETAGRTAAGALARSLLHEFDIDTVGYVVQMLDVVGVVPADADCAELRKQRDANEAYCCDQAAAQRMIQAVQIAKKDRDTVGGIIEVRAMGHPPGLGSCMRWQDKLDGRLMRAVGSVQAMKAVEIGLGLGVAARPGSAVHDPIHFDSAKIDNPSLGFDRPTNHAGGIEGGMTNGQPIVLRAAMKPISTLLRGIQSVDLQTKNAERSDYERSDVSAVPAASVVLENVVAFELAGAFLQKFTGDTLGEVRAAYENFLRLAKNISST